MSDIKHKGALRTIGEVATEVGIAAHVLRFWESKFSAYIKPQKRRGRRYYGEKDVDVIKTIKMLRYDHGYTINGIRKFLNSVGKDQDASAGIEALRNEVSTPIEKFRHDDAGNIVADNQSDEQQESQAGEISAEELEKLHQIYNGLCAARKKLRGGEAA